MQTDAEFEKDKIGTTFVRVGPVVGPPGGTGGSESSAS